MSKNESKNGLSKPLPGEQLPKYLRGCSTADEVRAKLETLNSEALDVAAKFRSADEGVYQAKQTLARQLQALVPVLREMQEILSHKSILHYRFADLDLPTFTEWANRFVAMAGIQASWSTIKAAMNPNRKSPSHRSEGHIPASKLQTQRVGYAALAGIELADSLVHSQDCDDALGRMRAAAASKADVLAVLKRAGVKDTSEFIATNSTVESEMYFHSESQLGEDPAEGSNVRPGGFSQLESLIDRAVGPAFHAAFNLDDPALQASGFERLASYVARKWVPFDANLGTMEFTVRFVPKEKPNLRREPAETPALEGRALVAATRLLSNPQGPAAVDQ